MIDMKLDFNLKIVCKNAIMCTDVLNLESMEQVQVIFSRIVNIQRQRTNKNSIDIAHF